MPPTFHELSAPGRIRRLRRLAEGAVVAFGVPSGARLTLLNHGENTTFRVAPTRGRAPQVLRIHRPGYQTPAGVRSELMWLRALAGDTDLAVPTPIRGRDGDPVQRVSHPGVEGARVCTLLRWVPGRFSIQPGSVAAHRRVGRLTARLHLHAATWRRPPGFRRSAWHAEGLLGAGACFGDPVATPPLSRSQRRVVRRARDKVLAELDAYGRGRDRYGLIHADLHPGNVLIQGEEAAAIDFDDCGSGWHMYDLAVSLSPSLSHPRFECAKAAYLEGYRGVRALDDEHVDRFDVFALTRRLTLLGWLARRADIPRIRRRLPTAMKGAAASCAQFLATGRITDPAGAR